MSSRSTPESAGLTIALDIRDPFSCLALRPAFDFAQETGVDVDWLPIRAHTLIAPSTPSPDDDRGTRHRRSRAQMIAREIAIYSEAQGLEIESPYREGPAEALHLAWLWIRNTDPSRLRAFLEEVFRKYWAREIDPESRDDVAQLLERLGHDDTSLQRWSDAEGPDAVRFVTSQLSEAGVFQAPAYVLDGEVFYGRQHLPMVQWILAGRRGERPI